MKRALASSSRLGTRAHRRQRGRIGAAGALALGCLAAAVSCTDTLQPDGPRVELNRDSVSLFPATSDTVVATVYDGRGTVAGAQVVWRIEDERVALVDTVGIVSAYDTGRTNLTATSGVLEVSIPVVVEADTVPPVLEEATASPALVQLNGGEVAVTFTIRARDGESGVGSVGVWARRPGDPAILRPVFCWSLSPANGSVHEGAWSCSWILNRYAAPGVWEVSAEAADKSHNSAEVSLSLIVDGSDADTTPPVLTTVTYSEERTTTGYHELRFFGIGASDSEAGMREAEILFSDSTGANIAACGVHAYYPPDSPAEWRAVRELQRGCDIPLVESSVPVILTLAGIRLLDLRGNERFYGTDELRDAGFITQIDITR